MRETPDKWKIFLLVATGIFMSTLDSSIVNVALPYILENLKTQLKLIQWVVLIYLLTISSLLLTFGRLSDILGRRTIYTIGFITFSLGSLFCSLSLNAMTLILARAVQGCGAAMLMACSPAMIVDTFPPNERGKALGAVVAAGLTAGPVLGGLILDLFSWRFIFFINIPIGFAAALIGSRLLKGTSADTRTGEPLDKKGALLLAIATTCLVLSMTQSSQWGFLSLKFIGLLTLCLVSFAGFVRTESTSAHPLFDPSLLRIRCFIFPVIAAVILFSAMFIIIFMMPFFLTHPCGFSASKVGLIMITPFSMLFFISPLAGSLYATMGSRSLCTFGMTLLCLSMVSFIFIQPSDPVLSILWRLALAGAGIALFISPNSTAAMNAVPPQRRGIASGAVATARNFGMVLGVATAGLIFSTTFSTLNNGSAFTEYSPLLEPIFMKGFHNSMTAGSLIAFSGILVSHMRGNDRQQT